MRHAPSALAVALLAALAPLARADDDCRRLVEPLGPTTLARGTHALAFSPPTTQGQWFVSVRRAGPSGGRVDFNGQTVVPASQLAGPGGVYALAPVTLRPGSNTLTVSVTGQGQLTVAVHGLVAPEHLAPGQGRAVGLVTLFERTLAGGTPPRRETTSVTLPTTDGLFELELRQGTPPATTASLDWNGAPVLGQQALRPGVPVARAGVAVTDTNALATDVRGPAGSRVHVALRGWIVDEAAPTAAWTSPTPGAAVAPTDALVLAFADALTGVGSVRIDLDGVDVTASFAVGDAQATATAGQLPLRPGQNTLRAVVRDRACNETTATVSFTSGGAGDTTPPTLEQPPDLVAEQTSPAGAVVTYDPPTATDAADPAPVVVCEPPSGALFAPGVTVVTCTATDAAGNSAQVTFTVTVRDTTPPALALTPADGATTSSPALLRAAWTDAGSGPDPASFQARLDGQDVTASFTVVADRATATLDLAAGARTFEVTLRDLAGNERVATSIFQVQAAAGTVARLELIVGSTAARRAAPDEEPLLTLAPEPRPIDGSGNDLTQPEEGRAGSRFLRLVAPDYADGHSAPAGPSRPGARAVSNGVHAQTGSVPAARRATDLLWIWGQFVGHDLSFTRPHDPAEPLPIPIPPNDSLYQYDAPTNHFPFLRSAYDPASSPREQRNELTAWLDGSMVYGSDDARAAALRTFEGGRLRTSAGDLLPRNTDALDPGPPTHFVAGDVRANQLTPLLALHTLFVREHNRLADLLRARHPDAPDEALYQGARRVVIAELQAITYQEFLPRLLGANGLPPSSGYDPAAQVGIFNEFAAAAFRLGHTLVSPHLLRLDAQNQPLGALDLRDAFFAPDRLTEGGGLDALLRGAARQPCQELDPLVVDGVRTYLFAPPGQGGLDLVALDLQRGRDHGLPAYNETRRRLGLPARTTFAEVTSDPLVRSRLAATYASIDDVDLLTGALCEDHLPGAMVGEILHQVLRAQFDLLRRGDRFFYEHAFSGPALDALRGLRLADVIRRNTGVGDELPDDVFTTPLEPFTENDLRIRALTEDGSLDPAFSGVVLVTSSDGRPPLDGLVAQLDQGQVTLPGLAFFQTVGTVVLTARTVPLDPGDPDASGTLAVEVVLQAPVIFPALPTSVAVGGELTIQGLSFVGQVVELVVDGQLVATEIAGPGGSFALTARLTPGAHQVLVRALDPTTGALVSSQSFTVDQAAPP
ncbi:MAG: HYR domain-containing protein, partial [Planctomycetota bacterium]|nr:HYR domain-containing protein [Planctomycetota bacterium]